MRRQPKILGGLGRQHHLLDRPFLPLLGLAVNRRRRKGIKGFVIGRIDRHELALQMR